MVEKAKTTPEYYPMTVAAIVAACNQKSNRDPITNYDQDDVEETLHGLRKKGVVILIEGSGRVAKWKHTLYDWLKVSKVELAVIAELLLRGPQTEGELRTRASRMEPIEDLDALRETLKPLVERNLVFYLTPEERRGAVLTHGFHDPRELERLRVHYASAAASVPPPVTMPSVAPPSSAVAGSRLEVKIRELEAQLGTLRDDLAATKQQVST